MEGGNVVLFGDEVHEAAEGVFPAQEGLVIDIDILEEHCVEAHQQVQVVQDHAVHHHENVVRPGEVLFEGVADGQREHLPPPGGPKVQFGDDFDDDFLDGREAGVVVQVIALLVQRGEHQVLPVTHKGGERVHTEGLFRTQGRFPGHQVRPLGGAQTELRKISCVGQHEGALEADISLLAVQLGHLAHDFPVSVDIGRVKADAVAAVAPTHVDVRGGTCGGEGGVGDVVLVLQDGSRDAGGDDLAVILRRNRLLQGHGPRNRAQEAARGVLLHRREKVVVMEDGQTHGGRRACVVQVEDGGCTLLDADPRGQFQRSFRCGRSCRQGLIGLFVQDLHTVGNPRFRGAVEDGQEAGASLPGGSFLGCIDRRVGDEAVGAGGGGDGNPERSGTPALQQAYLGRTDRSVGRDEFQVGDGAFVRKTAVSVHVRQGAPDGVPGQIHVAVGGDEDALHGSLSEGHPGQRQENGGQ